MGNFTEIEKAFNDEVEKKLMSLQKLFLLMRHNSKLNTIIL